MIIWVRIPTGIMADNSTLAIVLRNSNRNVLFMVSLDWNEQAAENRTARKAKLGSVSHDSAKTPRCIERGNLLKQRRGRQSGDELKHLLISSKRPTRLLD